MQRFGVFVSAVLVGCPAARPRATTNQAQGVEMAEIQPGFLSLADGRIVSTTDRPPAGVYVRGKIRDGRFSPEGDVEGEGPLGEAGQPGWMELLDGTFHGEQTGRPPFPPYVKGYMTPQGEFRPASRKVVYQ